MISGERLIGILIAKLPEVQEGKSELLQLLDVVPGLEAQGIDKIDSRFPGKERENIHFNLGFLYSANCENDEDISDTHKRLMEIRKVGVVSQEDYTAFLAGFDRHQDDYWVNSSEFEDKDIKAAFYIERALIMKYCTDNINAVSS